MSTTYTHNKHDWNGVEKFRLNRGIQDAEKTKIKSGTHFWARVFNQHHRFRKQNQEGEHILQREKQSANVMQCWKPKYLRFD